MSASTPSPVPPAPPSPGGFGERLPERLRARTVELPGLGTLRLVETMVLVVVGLLLAVATVNDVVLQTHTNHRIVADLRTWRQYTGHDYQNVGVEQDIYGHSTRDTVCGNTSPGPPKGRTQICLVMTGPVISGRRAVHSGWYLPPKSEDLRAKRYGCFGLAKSEGVCTA
jgi:hypothetical protein